MKSAQIGIVGGGLSGLYAAHLLEQMGVTDYVLLEAKPYLGGRLSSPLSESNADKLPTEFSHFDLGGTWYWPDIQPRLDRVIKQFGLKTYPQNEVGEMIIDRANFAKPMRVNGYISSPPMMRLAGGMNSLILAVANSLQSQRILTGHAVHEITLNKSQVELKIKTPRGKQLSITVNHVLIATPPRIATCTIKYSPNLPDHIFESWQDVNTWMAPNAKYLAVYDKPFWRSAGLSGEARSDNGPLGEIHDASIPNEAAALFGFLQLPALSRSTMTERKLKAMCRAQLVRMFGPEAENIKYDYLKDWATDKYTSTSADITSNHGHSLAPSPTISSGVWRRKLFGISSEWSMLLPGYIAGAIDAATNGVQKLQKEMLQKHSDITNVEEKT